jgi:tRNA U34 5-methylaminomethyl-2-thiouridine-forming methyltransferase MnmC
MKREIIITQDGSTSIYLPELNESYHSKFGAIQEAQHVFIKNGMDLFQSNDTIHILEIGFGTGLNAFITFLEASKRNQNIHYDGVEAYPVSLADAKQMNYVNELQASEFEAVFDKIHSTKWEEEIELTPFFSLTKRKQFFQELTDKEKFHLIYFDAFGFEVQPELWDETIFKIMFDALLPNGILVTYACRTSIKKAMLSVGFSVEKLPGAPGKREMLRAIKK